MAVVKFMRGTYKQFCAAEDKIIPEGYFVLVTELPWYKSWFGLKRTRLIYSDGKTEFKKLRFI